MNSERTSILVVDDEHTIVSMLTTFLAKNNYDVTGVTDPREALELVGCNRYDIVLTDLKMPFLSGMDIVRAVKETGHDTEIIIFTAYASIDSTIEALQHGVNDYVRKPFQLGEILVVIERAAEKLALKRKNLALQRRIEKMLTDITMLVDISSILYQVPDFDGAAEMILDTLTEGMKVRKVGLFLKDASQARFAIGKAKGLSGSFIEGFKFQLDDTINDVHISPSEPTIITDVDRGLAISGRKLDVPAENSLNCCIFAPIQYLESLHGFIGIFQLEERSSLEDELKLLKVLATQVAPIFQAHGSGLPGCRSDLSYDRVILNTIAERIETAKRLRSTVSFASFKLIGIPESMKSSSILNLGTYIRELIQGELPPASEAVLLNVDSILAVFPGSNPANIELTCANIRRRIAEQLAEPESDAEFPLIYAITTYPLEAASAPEIMNGLWMRLLDMEQPGACTYP